MKVYKKQSRYSNYEQNYHFMKNDFMKVTTKIEIVMSSPFILFINNKWEPTYFNTVTCTSRLSYLHLIWMSILVGIIFCIDTIISSINIFFKNVLSICLVVFRWIIFVMGFFFIELTLYIILIHVMTILISVTNILNSLKYKLEHKYKKNNYIQWFSLMNYQTCLLDYCIFFSYIFVMNWVRSLLYICNNWSTHKATYKKIYAN